MHAIKKADGEALRARCRAPDGIAARAKRERVRNLQTPEIKQVIRQVAGFSDVLYFPHFHLHRFSSHAIATDYSHMNP
jgi:hypothetical protein